jgi:hypothetical protein
MNSKFGSAPQHSHKWYEAKNLEFIEQRNICEKLKILYDQEMTPFVDICGCVVTFTKVFVWTYHALKNYSFYRSHNVNVLDS